MRGLVHEVSPPPRVGRLTASFAVLALTINVVALISVKSAFAEAASSTALVTSPSPNNSNVGTITPPQYTNVSCQSVHSFKLTGMKDGYAYLLSYSFELACDGDEVDSEYADLALIDADENNEFTLISTLSGSKSLQKCSTGHNAKAETTFDVSALTMPGQTAYDADGTTSSTVSFNVGPFVESPPGGGS